MDAYQIVTDRLNRTGVQLIRFGSEGYSGEELIAEMIEPYSGTVYENKTQNWIQSVAT